MLHKQSLLGTLLAVLAAPLAAAPILSIDMDPAAPGIQSTLKVFRGSDFTIDVVLDTDGESLNYIGFDLFPTGGSTGPLTATELRVNEGLFGSGISQTEVFLSTLDNGAGEIGVAVGMSLLGIPINGGGLFISSIDFVASTPGRFLLDLNDVVLRDFLGEVASEPPTDGSVDVLSVPVPAVAILLAAGFPLLLCMRICGLKEARPSPVTADLSQVR
jgi:hypothetical protein